MPNKLKKLGPLQRRILALLQDNPEGLDIAAIRSQLGLTGQQHLDRRVRDLDPYYIIERIRKGRRVVYRLEGERPEGDWEYAAIAKDLRAKILNRDGRRCRMCGRTVEEDRVKLQIDHKIPRSWGGRTEEKNLWALCSACNEGKKDHFETFDPAQMQEVFGSDSVHYRIALLLKTQLGEWVDCDLIEFVANFEDYQADWRKRLRELRYLGFNIEMKRRKRGKRHLSFYRLIRWIDLPGDLTRGARLYEKERAERNKKLARKKSRKETP